MTPTLQGRWQIRLFLLGTIGLIVALLTGVIVHNMLAPLIVLFYVFIQGVILDLLYQYIVTFRWDRDWPTSFQVAAGILEGALAWLLIVLGLLPFVPKTLPFLTFLAQYGITWLCIFVLTQGLLRIFSPDWHYEGGQWITSRPQRDETQMQASGFQQPLSFQPPFAASAPQRQPQQQPVARGPQVPLSQPVVCGPQLPPSQPAVQTPIVQAPQLPPAPAIAPLPPMRSTGQQPAVQRPSGPQPAVRPGGRPFRCVCGYSTDHLHGPNCPQCGRIAP